MPKIQESLRSIHYTQDIIRIIKYNRQNSLILGILGNLDILGI
jgi:hypothetical protein